MPVDDRWSKLSMRDRADLIKIYTKHGVTDLNEIRRHYNSLGDNDGRLTVNKAIDGVYGATKREENLGKPSHGYRVIKPEYEGKSEEELDRLVGPKDPVTGHRSDIIKSELHPTHPSRGSWNGKDFMLTDKGLDNVNYTYFGAADDNQDGNARLIYDNSTVLPEITITPNDAYVNNPYDNINLHLKANGGHLFAYGSPDHDPNNPYHYHTPEGEKVVITPEEWEANKGKPYFKEIEDAVNAEREAHPGPEYEIDQNYVNRLNRDYGSGIGSTNGAYNFRGYASQLPEGYTISDQGVIYDNEGNAYVQDWFTHRDYPYDVDDPITFTFNKGKGSERNEEFYPVKLKTTIKKPLPVDRTLPVEETKERLINEYIKTHSRKQKLYNVPWFEEIHMPYVYMYGNKNALVAPVTNQLGIGNNWYAFDIYGDKGEDPINIDNAEQYSSSHYISEDEMLKALNDAPKNIDVSDRDVILKPSFWEAGYKSTKPTREEALQNILISPYADGGRLFQYGGNKEIPPYLPQGYFPEIVSRNESAKLYSNDKDTRERAVSNIVNRANKKAEAKKVVEHFDPEIVEQNNIDGLETWATLAGLRGADFVFNPWVNQGIKAAAKPILGGAKRLTSKYVFPVINEFGSDLKNAPIDFVRSFAKTPLGKRTAESIMRQSSRAFRSVPELIESIVKNRRYILTGKGEAKGKYGGLYYAGKINKNSRVYGEKEDASIIGRDIISSYLHGTQLDESIGLLKPELGFGEHLDYVKREYPHKMDKIPIYEIGDTDPLRAYYLKHKDGKLITSSTEGPIPAIDKNLEVDAAGHLLVPTEINGTPAFYEQDIWKFNPKDYEKQYGKHPFFGMMGVNFIDAAGVPVITRTKPVEIPEDIYKFIIEKDGLKKYGGNLLQYGGPTLRLDDSQRNWLDYWYNNRSLQLKNNLKKYPLGQYGSDADKINSLFISPNKYKKEMFKRADDVPIFDKRKLKNEDMYYLAEKLKVLPLMENYQYEKYNELGAFVQAYGKKPFIGIFPGATETTPLHEYVHAMQSRWKGIDFETPQNIQPGAIRLKLDKNKYNDKYIDDPREIYSRLMELRYANKINPRHKWNKSELNEFKKKAKDFDILDRYDDNFLLYLFNEVAQNNDNIKTSNYSANGGYLGHITPYGQWQYPHQVTTIPSNNITMQGVDYPVVGVSDTGDKKLMLPGLDYIYDGNYVTEYPILYSNKK